MKRIASRQQSLADNSPAGEIVNRLVQMSAIVSSNAPLRERMDSFCEATTSILSCDRSTIFQWDGERYRGAFSYGLEASLVPHFHSPELSDLMIALIEGVEDFTVIHRRQNHELITDEVQRVAEVEAAVICPISHPDGMPLAILTAGFLKAPDQFDDIQTQILVGLASLIRVALVTESDHEASLRSLASRRELRLELDQTEQEARRRISVEIHDDSMQKLTSLHLSIAQLAADTQDKSIKGPLLALTDESQAAVASLGHMFSTLDPQCPSESTLIEALITTLRSLSIRTGWKTDLVNNLTVAPPARVQGELVQIARQALANADLHSRATTIWSELRTDHSGTLLTISDNGIGFEPADVPSNRFGLLSMRERAEAAGGTLVVQSEIGVGTVVSSWIPDDLGLVR